MKISHAGTWAMLRMPCGTRGAWDCQVVQWGAVVCQVQHRVRGMHN